MELSDRIPSRKSIPVINVGLIGHFLMNLMRCVYHVESK